MPWRWRKATWALAIFNVLMLWWVIAVAKTGAPHCIQGTNQCIAGANSAGAAIGVVFLLFVWFVGFIVLSLVWLMSRTSTRMCPQCGRGVKKGRIACKACGYSFMRERAPARPRP